MVDIPNDAEILALFKYNEGDTLLLASSDGHGFRVKAGDVLAQTKGGRQVMSLAEGAVAKACVLVNGDMAAVVGTNRKLLVFPVDQIPIMAKGRGVILQKYKGDAGLSDAKVFSKAEGLTWRTGNRTNTCADITPWLATRAGMGQNPPSGFSGSGRF